MNATTPAMVSVNAKPRGSRAHRRSSRVSPSSMAANKAAANSTSSARLTVQRNAANAPVSRAMPATMATRLANSASDSRGPFALGIAGAHHAIGDAYGVLAVLAGHLSSEHRQCLLAAWFGHMGIFVLSREITPS